MDLAQLLPRNTWIARVQPPAELRIMVQPPERRGGQEQVFGPLDPELLEVGDGSLAVGGVEAGVRAVGGTGEVPGAAPFGAQQVQQFLVAAADDEQRRAGRCCLA